MTGLIRTVTGDIEPAGVGLVLPHEHLFCDLNPVSRQLNHVLNDRTLAAEELAMAGASGVTCVVELTTPDIGRDPAALRAVSEATGMSVVMGTGWYRQPYFPGEVDRLPVAALAERMVWELTEGIPLDDGTTIRAGIIGEIGVDLDYVTAQEERVFRAVAAASLATGAPISTHTGIYPSGTLQLELLLAEGVDPRSIVIGHADMYLDRDYHTAILRTGAYLQFDTAGRTHLNPDDRRADFLVALIRDGWLEQLLVSSDRCFRSDLVAFGGVGYAHTTTTFRQLLLEGGVTEDELQVLMRATPLGVLAWA